MSQQIKCTQCGHLIDIEKGLTAEIQREFQEKYKQAVAQNKQKLEQEQKELLLAQEKNLRQKIELEEKEKNQLIQKELEEKSLALQKAYAFEAENQKLKREKEEMQSRIAVEKERELNLRLQQEREKIQKQEEEKQKFKLLEMQKQLEDQKKLTEEMIRKQEQGSMQLQGEVLELAIEDWLRSQFPLDSIEEIKKGARGGDCIQIVHTREKQNCGMIYYESKRTKEFQNAWIDKFKEDIKEKGAQIGVIITESMPSDLPELGQKQGIWICNFEQFKNLSKVLRQSLIELDRSLSSQENKGEKMQLLYDYLTSNTFRMQVEGIVEGFVQMKESLESEKRALQRIWKEREKQLDKLSLNTIHMHGSIKGIVGAAIQPIELLALDQGLEIEE